MDGLRPPPFLPRPAAAGGGGPGLFKPAAPQQQEPAQPGSQEQHLQGDGSGLVSPHSPFESSSAPAGGRGKLPPPPALGFGLPHTNPLYGGGSGSPTSTPEALRPPPVPGTKRFDLENAGGSGCLQKRWCGLLLVFGCSRLGAS